MNDAAVPAQSGQRRFRQRGGAKKKKKRLEKGIAPEDAVVSSPTRSTHRVVSAPDATADFGPAIEPGTGSTAQFESQLDPELSQYLVQLRGDIEALGDETALGSAVAEDPDDPSSMLLLCRNALLSLKANMHEVAIDPMGSRVMETLIRGASSDMDALGDALSAMLTLGARRMAALADHRCGSHVLQSLVEAVLAGARFAGSIGGSAWSAVDTLLRLLTVDWTVEELVTLMSNSCGSHVFRVMVAGLAGIPTDEPKEQKLDDSSGSKRIRSYIDRCAVDVPDEWLAGLGKVVERLLESDSGTGIHGLLWSPSSCAALQALLSAVVRYDRDVAKRFAVVALKDSVLDLCYDACGARFVERVIVCLGAAFVTPFLKGNFALLALDSKGNYVVQRVLLGVRGRGAVMSLWDDLEPSLPTMVGYGSVRVGVVLAMLRCAEVEGDEQVRRRAARAIAKNVGAVGAAAKHLCGVLITGSMKRWESWKSGVQDWARSGMGIPVDIKPEEDGSSVLRLVADVPRIGLLGVLMARSLMRFPGGPGQGARDSMSNLLAIEVLALCADPSGSRLIEQWIDSDDEHGARKAAAFVVSAVLDSRECAQLVGAFARSPYGAQVLIRAIPLVPTALKKRAMESLAAVAEQLKDHAHGRQVVKRCRVLEFIRRQDDWNAAESARDTRARMFADILDTDEGEPKTLNQKSAKDHLESGRRASPDPCDGNPVQNSLDPDSVLLVATKTGRGERLTGKKKTKRDRKDSTVDNPGQEEIPADKAGFDSVLNAIKRAAHDVPATKKRKRKKVEQ